MPVGVLAAGAAQAAGLSRLPPRALRARAEHAMELRHSGGRSRWRVLGQGAQGASVGMEAHRRPPSVVRQEAAGGGGAAARPSACPAARRQACQRGTARRRRQRRPRRRPWRRQGCWLQARRWP
eukprot:5148228-Lingulodinium_polyedra.AAC.1